MDNKLKQYQTVETLGNSKVELVIKVYNGAIANLKLARKNFEQDNLQISYDALEKAKKFLVHLYTTLDEEKGGDIAIKLGELYAFVIDQINLVQATKEVARLDELVEILENIRDGWVELAERAKEDEKAAGKNPHEKYPTDNIKISV